MSVSVPVRASNRGRGYNLRGVAVQGTNRLGGLVCKSLPETGDENNELVPTSTEQVCYQPLHILFICVRTDNVQTLWCRSFLGSRTVASNHSFKA
jgi:hypothetical protein